MQCGYPSDCKGGPEREQKWDPSASTSNPELAGAASRPRRSRDAPAAEPRDPRRTPRESAHSASESNLAARQNDSIEHSIPIEPKSIAGGDEMASEVIQGRETSPGFQSTQPRKNIRQDKGKCLQKRAKSCAMEVSGPSHDADMATMRQVRDIHNDMRSSARIIRDSRLRLMELQKKSQLKEQDLKELVDRHDLLLREMARFDRLTRCVQQMVDHEVVNLRKGRDATPSASPTRNYLQNYGYDKVVYQEMKMAHPTVTLGRAPRSPPPPALHRRQDAAHSKSEIDLTRKLSESYDMQEKLVADNADLEVKRYILYKELMTKDQNLETCRAQVNRLQGELKLISKENALLLEKIARNCPEGDACSVNYDSSSQSETQKNQVENQDLKCELLFSKLESYQNSTTDFENQLNGLESEVRVVREDMDALKKLAEDTSRAGPGAPACSKGSCIIPSKQPPPKKGQPCGVCPPCQAPCNPLEPPTPLEREVAKLSIEVKTLQESLKTKITECAILRSEVARKKEDLDKERTQHKEATAELKAARQQNEIMTTHYNMMVGTKDQASDVEYNVKMLKQCYREAREEIDELRMLLKEQNEQLQNYRNKYMQSMQQLEEQKRQMDNMDMDNTRISEQINLEILRIKNNFQEKLMELTPLPDLLKKTEAKLKEALQSQAMAEHKAEQLASELIKAREKIHTLMHTLTNPVEEPKPRRDDSLMEALQDRITQLTQNNMSLKEEIERLKANVIRMEEAVLVNETRLAEKMHECAKLGAELDKTRDEATRVTIKANERVDTLRQTMQITKTEMERELAAGRAQLRMSEKNCQEIQCRMQCQIQRLRENYEQAQLRILGMNTIIQKLRLGQGDVSEDTSEECLCGVTIS